MPTPTEQQRGISQAARTLYEQRLRQELEPTHNGEIIAIEPVSGAYVLGRTLQEIDEACRNRFGQSPVHILRIGGGGAVKIMGRQRVERVP